MSSLQSKMALRRPHGAPGHAARKLVGELSACLVAALALTLVAALPAMAVPVADLYEAQVPTDGLGTAELEAAYARALDQVLVRVTGQASVAMDSTQRAALGSAGTLVRRYQPMPDGQLRVSFDPDAVRRRLDAAGLPVWSADRPRTLILLPGAADPTRTIAAGSGSAAGDDRSGGDPDQQLLLQVAARRGVPVTISRVADPPADPAVATMPADADALLVGRRLPTAGAGQWGWTLVQRDGGRTEWQGDLAAGVNGLADRLAARYAGTAMAGPPLRLRILGITSFDAYGRVQAYLRRVGVIQHLALAGMTGGTLTYDVVVRGDARQLADAFALQGVLEPVAPGAGTTDLDYRLATVR